MAKEGYRYYMNFRKIVHRRAESWFDDAGEKVYKENYTRVKGIDDLTLYESSKPKSKSNSKKKTSGKKNIKKEK